MYVSERVWYSEGERRVAERGFGVGEAEGEAEGSGLGWAVVVVVVVVSVRVLVGLGYGCLERGGEGRMWDREREGRRVRRGSLVEMALADMVGCCVGDI